MENKLDSTYKRFAFVIATSGLLFLLFNIISFYVLGSYNAIFISLLILSFSALPITYIYFFRKEIQTPLNIITNALKTNNLESISEYKIVSKDLNEIGSFLYECHFQKEELLKAKEKAEESEILKASFLTNLSHEIRTPMNAILGFADLLGSQKLKESEKKEYIEVIRGSGENLVSIIDDLIEMSKIDTHQVKPNYNGFNLDETLNEIKQTIEITIDKNKPVELILDQPKHPVIYQLISDKTKFKQIIVNVINNAIKYTEKGSVNFGYKINSDSNALEFYVKDTGIGISEEDRKNIFDRFNRIQNDKTINLSGLGLGLSISKAYLEMLGGDIWLESKENIGTTFYFTIPLKLSGLPAEIKKTIKLNPNDKAKPLNILIAEDNTVNFMLLQQIFKVRDYNIIRASNGEEAVSICRDNDNIQLVIMDLKMPKMDGFEARKIIRQFKPYLPIIAHTAHTSAEIHSQVYNAGFIDCIAKPLDRTKLFRVIDRIEHLTPNLILSKAV